MNFKRAYLPIRAIRKRFSSDGVSRIEKTASVSSKLSDFEHELLPLADKIVQKLPENKENDILLGRALTSRIITDVKEGIEDIRRDGNTTSRALKQVELEKYIESMERLASNKYAIEHNLNIENRINRHEELTSTWTTIETHEIHRRLSPIPMNDFIRLPVHIQDKIQSELLDYLDDQNSETEVMSLNYNGRVPRSKQILLKLSNTRKFYYWKKEMRAKYADDIIRMKSGESNNHDNLSLVPNDREALDQTSKLYIEPSERPDPTVAAVQPIDIVDSSDQDSTWTGRQRNKRIAINTAIFMLCLSFWKFAYDDIIAQIETGGFQGVWVLGKRIL